MQYCVMNSQIGKLLLAGDARGLQRVSLLDGDNAAAVGLDWAYDETPFREAIHQFHGYFQGERRTFSLTLNPDGTPFQQRVWNQIQTIGYGKTASYSQIAQAVGNPRACRAVGAANGKNPLCIVIPCHRVIGRSGGLVGYSCGIRFKRELLALERHHHPGPPDGASLRTAYLDKP